MSIDNMNEEECNIWIKGQKDLANDIKKNGLYICPECNNPMGLPPIDYNICPSCMKEFGYDAEMRPDIQPVWKSKQ